MPEPRCDRRDVIVTHHGRTRLDPYDWLRDTDSPDVLEHLAAENAHTDRSTRHVASLRERLFAEVSARTEQTDMSVPDYTEDSSGRAWWVYARTTEGAEHPTYHRARAGSEDDVPDPRWPVVGEETLVDLNSESADHDYLGLGDLEISPNGTRLLWSVDLVGDELYTVRVRDLDSGTILDEIHDTAGACWLGDDHLVWLEPDDALRPWRAHRHRIGDDPVADEVIWTEPDERFWLGVDTSRDRQWLILTSAGKTSTEQGVLPLSDLTGTPWLVCPRIEGLEYEIEPAGDRFLVLHNAVCPDFEIGQAPTKPSSPAEWTPVIAGVLGQRLLGVDAYHHWVVVTRRVDGVPTTQVHARNEEGDLDPPQVLSAEGPLTVVTADDADRYDTDRIRIHTESYITPARVSELRLDTGAERLVKTLPVKPDPEGRRYDTSSYREWRVWATGDDGTPVPISLVARRDITLPAACLVYAYGAYESALDPGFSVSRLGLLDRGVVVAYAHVRGGGELGRAWYEAGRREHKPHTFTDLVACVRHLVAEGIADPDRVALRGFSAGGLTVGAALNLAPELVRAAHVGVGFLDPLTDMLDPDLPLTVTERDEWGDPLADPVAYDLIASYSPYDNVRPVRYPAILATGSLHDQRVSCAEPAKWVAALRERSLRDEARPILLRTDLTSGHAGPSGRYQGWRDEAYEQAWLLDQLDAVDPVPRD